MNISTRKMESTAVLEIMDARIDAATAVEFKDQVRAIIDDGQHDIILDLSRVDFIDSSGLGAIVGVLKYLGQRGTLTVAGVTASVESMFKLTRMDRVFRLYPNVEAALSQ